MSKTEMVSEHLSVDAAMAIHKEWNDTTTTRRAFLLDLIGFAYEEGWRAALRQTEMGRLKAVRDEIYGEAIKMGAKPPCPKEHCDIKDCLRLLCEAFDRRYKTLADPGYLDAMEDEREAGE